MTWIKKGRIDIPQRALWSRGFLTPTPVLFNDDIIRVYVGCWGEDNISRLGYVDLAAESPSRVIGYSEEPIIPLGAAGCFDDNGMILGDVIRVGDEWRIYYVGFQHAANVKFMAFSGCCVGPEDGRTFRRLSSAPILDRSDAGLFIRAIHTVIPEGNGFKVWYSAGSAWQKLGDREYPCYEIFGAHSEDGIQLSGHHKAISCGPGEYRIGRPRASKSSSGDYLMTFTYDTLKKEYRVGAARSLDGKEWMRDDSLVGLAPSEQGWDSEMICYPVRVTAGSKEYLFYSGNGMGRTGFGYAEREAS